MSRYPSARVIDNTKAFPHWLAKSKLPPRRDPGYNRARCREIARDIIGAALLAAIFIALALLSAL